VRCVGEDYEPRQFSAWAPGSPSSTSTSTGAARRLFGAVRGVGCCRIQRINPLHLHLPMNQAKRCRAKSKRTGRPCKAPAVKGWSVCRMHGAGGGAPEGNKNALRHGSYTVRAIAARRAIRALLRASRALISAM
jgi:hypothetical protein